MTHLESSIKIAGSKSKHKLQEQPLYKQDLLNVLSSYKTMGSLNSVEQKALVGALQELNMQGVIRNTDIIKKAPTLEHAFGVFEQVADTIITAQYNHVNTDKSPIPGILQSKTEHLGTTKHTIIDNKQMQKFVNELAQIMLANGNEQESVNQLINKVVLSTGPNTPVRFESNTKLDIQNLKPNLTTKTNDYIYDPTSNNSKQRFNKIQKQIDNLQQKYFKRVVKGAFINETHKLNNIQPAFMYHKDKMVASWYIEHSGGAVGGKTKSLVYNGTISSEGFHGAGKFSTFNIMMMGDEGPNSVYRKYMSELLAVKQEKGFNAALAASNYNSVMGLKQRASNPYVSKMYEISKTKGQSFYNELLTYTENMRFFKKQQDEFVEKEGKEIYDKAIGNAMGEMDNLIARMGHENINDLETGHKFRSNIGQIIENALGLREGFHFDSEQFNHLKMFMENVPGVEHMGLGIESEVLSLKLPNQQRVAHVTGNELLPETTDIIHIPKNVSSTISDGVLQRMDDDMHMGKLERRIGTMHTLSHSGKEVLDLAFLSNFANHLNNIQSDPSHKLKTHRFRASIKALLMQTHSLIQGQTQTVVDSVGKMIRGNNLKNSQKLKAAASGGFTMKSTRTLGKLPKGRKTIYMSERAFANQWSSMMTHTDTSLNELLKSNVIRNIVDQHEDKYLDDVKRVEKKFGNSKGISRILQRAMRENNTVKQYSRDNIGKLLKQILTSIVEGNNPDGILKDKNVNINDHLSLFDNGSERFNSAFNYSKQQTYLTKNEIAGSKTNLNLKSKVDLFFNTFNDILHTDTNKDILNAHSRIRTVIKNAQNREVQKAIYDILGHKDGGGFSKGAIEKFMNQMEHYVSDMEHLNRQTGGKNKAKNIKELIRHQIQQHKENDVIQEKNTKIKGRNNNVNHLRNGLLKLKEETAEIMKIGNMRRNESVEEYAKRKVQALVNLSDKLTKSTSVNSLDSKSRKSFMNILTEYKHQMGQAEEEIIQAQQAKAAAKGGYGTNMLLRHPDNSIHSKMTINVQLLSGELIDRLKKDGNMDTETLDNIRKHMNSNVIFADPLDFAKLEGDFDGDIGWLFARAVDHKYGAKTNGSIITDNITEIMRDGLFVKEEIKGKTSVRPLNLATGMYMENLHSATEVHKSHNLISVKEWINSYAKDMAYMQGKMNIDNTSESEILKRVTKFVTQEFNNNNKTSKEVNLDNIYYMMGSSHELMVNKNEDVQFKLKVLNSIKENNVMVGNDRIGILDFIDADLSSDNVRVANAKAHKDKLDNKYKIMNSSIEALTDEHRNKIKHATSILANVKDQAKNVALVKDVTGKVDKLNRTMNTLAFSLLDAGPLAKNTANAARQLGVGFTFATIQQSAIGGKHGFVDISKSILELFGSLQREDVSTARGKELAEKHADKWMSGYIDAEILNERADQFRSTGFNKLVGTGNASTVNMKEIVAFHEAYSNIANELFTVVSQDKSTQPVRVSDSVFQKLRQQTTDIFKQYNGLHNTDRNVDRFIAKSLKYIQGEAINPLNSTDMDFMSKIKAISIESSKSAADSQGNINRLTTGKYAAFAKEGFMKTAGLFSAGRDIGLVDDFKTLFSLLNSKDMLGYQKDDYVQQIQKMRDRHKNTPKLLNAMLQTMGAVTPEFEALSMMRRKSGDMVAITKRKVRRSFDNLIKEGSLPKMAKVMVGMAAVGAFAPEPAVGTSIQNTPSKMSEASSDLPSKILKYNNNVAHVSYTPEWVTEKINKRRHEQRRYKEQAFRSIH